MPSAAPRLCACGMRVEKSARCPCEQRQDAARKARFDASRKNSSARGYNRTWERERKAYLALHPYCRFCGKAASVVDHIEPHRGDDQLFWDKTNWQALCAPCHNSTKQRLERRTKG